MSGVNFLIGRRTRNPALSCWPLNASDVRRDFRTAIKTAEGIDPRQWETALATA